MSARIMHYWDGYGILCMTEDGRGDDAQCDSDPLRVTCERCKKNLRFLGKLPAQPAHQPEGDV